MKKTIFSVVACLVIAGCIKQGGPQVKIVEGEALHTTPVGNNSLSGLWETRTISLDPSDGKIIGDKTHTICLFEKDVPKFRQMTLLETLNMQSQKCSGKMLKRDNQTVEFELDCFADPQAKIKGTLVSEPEEMILHTLNKISSQESDGTTVQITATSKRLSKTCQ